MRSLDKPSLNEQNESFFHKLGILGKDLGQSIVATPKTIWDIADGVAHSGGDLHKVSGAVKEAVTKGAVAHLKPLGDVADMPVIKPALEKAMVPFRNYVAPALTAGLLDVNPEFRKETANMSELERLKAGWTQSRTVATPGVNDLGYTEPYDKWRRNISPGQALVGDIGALVPGKQGSDKISWNNPDEVKDFYGHSLPQFFSGVSDFGFSFLDPTIVVGKTVKAARAGKLGSQVFERGGRVAMETDAAGISIRLENAQAAAMNRMAHASDQMDLAGQALDEADKLTTTIHASDEVAAKAGTKAKPAYTNEWTPVLERLKVADKIGAFNDPLVRSMPPSVQSVVAHNLGEASTAGDVSLILRATVADKSAIAALIERHADLGHSMNRAMNNVDELMKLNVNPEQFMADGTHFPWTNPAVLSEAGAELDAMVSRDASLKSLIDAVKDPSGLLKRGAGSRVQQIVDSTVANARSARFAPSKGAEYVKQNGVVVTSYQPTKFHRLVNIVTRPFNEIPSGHVNLNEADSVNEIMAVVQRGQRIAGESAYKGVDPVTGEIHFYQGIDGNHANNLVSSYISAATPEARSLAVLNIEEHVFKAISARHGANEELQNAILKEYRKARTTAQDSWKQNGYMVDADHTLHVDPFFESQTANTLPMMDFDLVHNLYKRNGRASVSTLNKLADSGEFGAIRAMDFMNDLFKTGALMRLGYGIRNNVEAHARIVSQLGPMVSLQHLGEGFTNSLTNVSTGTKRVVDSYRIGRELPPLPELETQLAELGIQQTNLERRIADSQRDYDLSVAANQAPPPAPKPFVSKVLSNDELDEIMSGNLPERFYHTKEYKADFAAAKKLARQNHAFNLSQDNATLQKVENLNAGFSLTTREQEMLEKHGVVPLKKVLEEFDHRGPNGSEGLSALLEHGDSSFGISYGDAVESTWRGRGEYIDSSFRIGKVRYVEVPWYPSKIKNEAEIAAMLEEHTTNWAADKVERLAGEHIDALDAHEAKAAAWRPPAIKAQNLSDIAVWRAQHQEVSELYNVINSHISRVEENAKKGQKVRFGSGTWEYTALNGKKYILPEAFSGPFGDIRRASASSAETISQLADHASNMYRRGISDGGIGIVKPGDRNYFGAWADALNKHLGNSQVVKMLASGKSVDEVSKWLRSSADGRDLRRRLGDMAHYESDQHVTDAKNFLDLYMPDAMEHPRFAQDGGPQFTANELRDKFRNKAELPWVHGHVLETNLSLADKGMLTDIKREIFRVIGSMPEDALSRNPVYASIYKREMQSRIDLASARLGKDEILTNEEIQAIDKNAHSIALHDMKQLLFTIDRKTSAATTLRWVLPFFSAYLNMAKTWGRIIAEKPYIATRAYNLTTAPNRAGMAYDSNGNLVPSDKASMNDTLYLHVPEGLANKLGLGGMTEMGVSKRSLDVITQGSLALPVGPPIAIAASEIVKRQPSTADSLAWAIPYGPDRNALLGVLPPWAKRQWDRSQGQNSQQYANTYEMIWNTEQVRRKQAGQKPATEKQIRQMTDSLYNLRTAASLILPFSPTFNSPYRFYIDKWHQYQTAFGSDAQTKFYNDFGTDFFAFSASLSKNTSGTMATVGAVDNAKKYSSLVEEISHIQGAAQIDPSMIGLVTNYGQKYKFSGAAYLWEQINPVTAGSATTFRTKNSPAEAQAKNQADMGWIEFRNVNSQIDTVLHNRGLKTIDDAGAGDLKAIKAQAIKEIAKNNNPWALDYRDTNGSKFQVTRQVFNAIVSDKKFMKDYGNDPTWKSVSLYLQIQGTTENILKKRAAASKAGYKHFSGSLTAKSNADVKAYYDTYINKLKQQDNGFGDLYDRYFAYDPVYDSLFSEIGK